jgi:hypothetical protein
MEPSECHVDVLKSFFPFCEIMFRRLGGPSESRSPLFPLRILQGMGKSYMNLAFSVLTTKETDRDAECIMDE